jgi:tetrachlorobenzoquinone reductase
MDRPADAIEARVGEILRETSTIIRLELRPCGGPFPAFTAGSHIDLRLPGGLCRSYSLLNSQGERDRYVIGVHLEPNSRGGSRYIHDAVAQGDLLSISHPRNSFALCEDAPQSILIAGGIGITPLLSMARRLHELQKPWKLFYCSRTRGALAFLEDLRPYGGHVELRLDDETQGLLDIASLMRGVPEGHFYCCGPKPMLAAFATAAEAEKIPTGRAHVEHFQPATPLPPPGGGFVVELARSRRSIVIPAGKTILQTLQEAGIATTSACEAGICGACEVEVLEGVPDHKDYVLTDSERASNKKMMICCSGSRSDRLVLDL